MTCSGLTCAAAFSDATPGAAAGLDPALQGRTRAVDGRCGVAELGAPFALRTRALDGR